LTPHAIPTSLHASLLARLDRLAPVREVAQIAAAVGRQFSHELIGAVAGMPERQLDDALDQLVASELLFRRGTPPDAESTFKHVLVQDAAYSTLLKSRRQQVHDRIVATLEEKFPDVVASQPAILAQHCREAALIEKSVCYWLKSGQQSVARSAMTEAVVQLKKGLELIGTLDDLAHQLLELDLRISLGPALIATKGYAAAEVAENYITAQSLAEEFKRFEYLIPLLHGQWAYHNVRSELKLALQLAEQVEKIGKRRDDITAISLGYYLQGNNRFQLGEFAAARALLERCQGLGNSAYRAWYSAVAPQDPYSTMLASLAVTQTHLGYIDQGRDQMSKVLLDAYRTEHPYTLAYMLFLGCLVERVVRSLIQAQQRAEKLVNLSNEHGFPFWLAWGTIHRGWSLTALGQPKEGVKLLTEGISAFRATGAVLSTPWALISLAETYAQLGQPDECSKCLTEAEQGIERTDERCDEAELHRVRGDSLNTAGDLVTAEQSYEKALAVARRQSAKVYELCATTSLTRLWRDQGKRTEARDLLAPIYGWFTEGFDTPVLQDAKTLLDELA